MKKFLYIILFSVILFSCKKQTEQAASADYIPVDYLTSVKVYLRKNLSPSDYANLDFASVILSKQQTKWYLKFGFTAKKSEPDFLLLQTDSLGHCNQGKIIQLKKDETGNNPSLFNGSISMETLNHQLLLSSRVTGGYIEALHPIKFSKLTVNSEGVSTIETNIIPVYYDELPEVVVVGYIPSGGGISYSDLMSFASMLNNGGGSSGSGNGPGSGGSGSYSGMYSPLGGGSSGGSGSPGGNNNLLINYESSIYKPGINVAAYMKCFSTIADAGSQCSVTIFTDLPVNNDPSEMFNWYTGDTGHAFLQLTKTNGTQSVTQIVGFTAQKPLQAIGAPNPVASKIVDNTGHKYNAYLAMNITPSQLNSEIQEIEFLSGIMPYSIQDYNCVDFALQVVNTIRGINPLIIPKYQIPGQPAGISNTPEGLYKILNNMKAAGGPEAKNILTGAVLNAGNSHGACN
jgi:uncharacterized membrane protein YgcG